MIAGLPHHSSTLRLAVGYFPGFDTGEIDLRTRGLEVTADSDPTDVLPDPIGASPTTRPDDVWLLGQHRIVCASALKAGGYDTRLDDPRYNVPIPRHVSGPGSIRHPDFVITPEAYIISLLTSSGLSTGYSQPRLLHFNGMAWRHMHEMQTAGSRIRTEQQNLCFWLKRVVSS